MDTTKTRKENWTKAEVDALVTGYASTSDVIDGRFSVSLTHRHKEEAWSSLLERVNSQSSTSRTVKEIKKKLSDVKTNVKRKERQRRTDAKATGGGPAPKLEVWEETIVKLLPDDTVIGFSGIDTFGSNLTENDDQAVGKNGGNDDNATSTAPNCNIDIVEQPKKKLKTDKHKEVVTSRSRTVAEKDNEVIQLLREILEEQKKTNQLLSEMNKNNDMLQTFVYSPLN